MPEVSLATEAVNAEPLTDRTVYFTSPAYLVGESRDIDYWTLLEEARIVI